MRFMLSAPFLDVVPAGTEKEERAQNDKSDEDVLYSFCSQICLQSYKGLANFGMSNCTYALQMVRKFITFECKIHYKLYKKVLESM